MSDVIKMDYGLMEEMSKTFQEGAQQLQQTHREMQQLAQMLEDGALLGKGGAAFTAAINGKLCTSITKLEQKFTQLDQNIRGAVQDMKAADNTSKGKF